MKNGERVIPFSKKDRRLLRRQLRAQLLRTSLYLLAVLLLLATLFIAYDHLLFRFFAGAAMVCFALLLALQLFNRPSNLTLRLLRDLNNGKKRVIHGQVEQVSFQQQKGQAPNQIYEIGQYRFELGQLSPVLKKFRQVMPGQTVEIHQCLHSGMILQVEVLDHKPVT